METKQTVSPLASALITAFEEQEAKSSEPKLTVNPFVSELASWYERLRNAMDIRDDEVVMRSAIERILKRRLLVHTTGGKIAEPLLRELLWAKYFPDNTLAESIIHQVAEVIDNYLLLKNKVIVTKQLPENVMNAWTRQVVSAEISKLLRPNRDKETMSNFMFQILQNRIKIVDDTEDTKNVQILLAIRRAFAKDDIAFLRYHLFHQIYDGISREKIEQIVPTFIKGYQEIEKQLNYPIKEKMYLYVKKMTPVFFILEDVLQGYKTNIIAHVENQEELAKAVYAACDVRYRSITSKVRNAIIRSVFFLLLTKVIIAYAVEGTYDKILYGRIIWQNLLVNIIIPPLLMIIVGLFIRTPSQENSKRIFARIQSLLFDEQPEIGYMKSFEVHPKHVVTPLTLIFGLLWFLAFVISFGLIIYVLNKFHFNIISQAIFIFFLTIVSFLSYRINLTANMYKIEDKQGILTPFVDFLFLPIIKVGMKLTDGISQINIIIFVFDFFIEAPFKIIFGFFEKWFTYLHTKREDLG